MTAWWFSGANMKSTMEPTTLASDPVWPLDSRVYRWSCAFKMLYILLSHGINPIPTMPHVFTSVFATPRSTKQARRETRRHACVKIDQAGMALVLLLGCRLLSLVLGILVDMHSA